MAKPREHALAKKLRRFAGHTDDAAAKTNFLIAARNLDQTIASLGIWKDPARIATTAAYRQAERYAEAYERDHPGAR